MATELGTRTRQTERQGHAPGTSQTKSFSRDVGMSKNVAASIAFVPGTAQITAANGTFAAFAVGDPVLIQGTNLNNGYFAVTGIDAANSAYLTLDPAPKAEGPTPAIVRTP